MKPIEYCLDELLKKLEDNWNQPGDRLFLDGEGFLKEVEYPIRLEYFKELIDILIEDGYARLVHEKSQYPNEFKWYENATIITAKGLLFRKTGYQKKLAEEKSSSERIASLETNMYRVTLIAAVATAGILILEVAKWIVSRLDMVFCSCP